MYIDESYDLNDYFEWYIIDIKTFSNDLNKNLIDRRKILNEVINNFFYYSSMNFIYIDTNMIYKDVSLETAYYLIRSEVKKLIDENKLSVFRIEDSRIATIEHNIKNSIRQASDKSYIETYNKLQKNTTSQYNDTILIISLMFGILLISVIIQMYFLFASNFAVFNQAKLLFNIPRSECRIYEVIARKYLKQIQSDNHEFLIDSKKLDEDNKVNNEILVNTLPENYSRNFTYNMKVKAGNGWRSLFSVTIFCGYVITACIISASHYFTIKEVRNIYNYILKINHYLISIDIFTMDYYFGINKPEDNLKEIFSSIHELYSTLDVIVEVLLVVIY